MYEYCIVPYQWDPSFCPVGEMVRFRTEITMLALAYNVRHPGDGNASAMRIGGQVGPRARPSLSTACPFGQRPFCLCGWTIDGTGTGPGRRGSVTTRFLPPTVLVGKFPIGR